MKFNRCLLGILAASVGYISAAGATELELNGFMSVVGGKTLSAGDARNQFTGEITEAVFSTNAASKEVYDDSVSFKSDSNYGLQIEADLGDGLSVIGQLTAIGGDNFHADIAWAYVSYDFNDEWNFQAGRQRLPLFLHSDFLDVGYTYHWIRPPQDLPAAFVDTFEGVKLSWTPRLGEFDWRFELLRGTGEETLETLGNAVATSKKIVGFNGKASNDWLQLRVSYMEAEGIFDIATNTCIGPGASIFCSNGVPQATEDDPLKYRFFSASTQINIDKYFVVAEYAVGKLDEPFATDGGVVGAGDEFGWYVSSGLRLDAFTPHITYGHREQDISSDGFGTGLSSDAKVKQSSITLGLRWDFHPSAAFKVEYLTRDDDTDFSVKNNISFFGKGDSLEVSLFTVGVDVIF